MEITKVVIGLEVHIELKTLSKMFCSCSADHFGKLPNTQTCPTCLGLPGALPVPNKKAIEWTILFGLSVGAKIPKYSRFDRKNYFYPDLPKGYQISQYDFPFCLNGELILKREKRVRLRRVHLEEDTAKLVHVDIDGERFSLIDFNRSGVPLMEIVSEPDLHSSEEAKEYLEKLQQVVRYLGISDADMEKGSMRCEPNINLEISDEDRVYYTPIVELKNINSFRFVKKAIDFEIERQLREFKESGEEKAPGNKKTRGWDEVKQITVLQREKEEANDYRYFPDPDIPPFEWNDKDIKKLAKEVQKYELPWDRERRFINQYKLSEYQSIILTKEKKTADYFEECVKIGRSKGVKETEIANIIINKRAPENLSPEKLVEFICASKTINPIDEKKIDQLINKFLSEHPESIEGYTKGKTQALGLIVGLVKKETGMVVPVEKIVKIIKNGHFKNTKH